MSRWFLCGSLGFLLACNGLGGKDEPDEDGEDDDDGGGSAPAHVDIEGFDRFGTVGSAIWYLHPDAGIPMVELLTVSDGCAKFVEYREAYEAYVATFEGVDEADWCREAKDEVLALVDAASVLQPAGSRALSLGAYESESGASAWEMGTHHLEFGASYQGTVMWIEEDPYAGWAELWDEDGSPEDYCGVGELTYEPLWGEIIGPLTVTQVVEGDHTTGSVDGTLETEDEIGAITASFTATWCELP